MNRPVTTLFMLMAVDGKISTGAADVLDVDRDFPLIPGLRESLPQYYEIEQWHTRMTAEMRHGYTFTDKEENSLCSLECRR